MPASAPARQHDHPGDTCFALPAIQRAVAEELRQGGAELAGVYGRSGLQIRGCRSLPAQLKGHRLHSLADVWMGARGLEGDFRSHEQRLALRSGSLSLVYLVHALEGARDAAGLLAECARVIEPDGALLLLAFNPVSPFRMRWMGQGLHAFGAGQSAGMVRAAGLEVQACRHLGVCWRPRDGQPGGMPGPLARLSSSYLILARRRDAGLTPLRLGRKAVPLGATASTG